MTEVLSFACNTEQTTQSAEASGDGHAALYHTWLSLVFAELGSQEHKLTHSCILV